MSALRTVAEHFSREVTIADVLVSGPCLTEFEVGPGTLPGDMSIVGREDVPDQMRIAAAGRLSKQIGLLCRPGLEEVAVPAIFTATPRRRYESKRRIAGSRFNGRSYIPFHLSWGLYLKWFRGEVRRETDARREEDKPKRAALVLKDDDPRLVAKDDVERRCLAKEVRARLLNLAPTLGPRRAELARRIGKGDDPNDAATRLFGAKSTARVHLSRLLDRLRKDLS